ncbi:MAG: glycine dehydrogenase (aminomethyl-transferring), partial [Marinirhabdus sp.]
MNTDSFALRHIGPRRKDLDEMLKTIGAETIEQLILETIPKDIRLKQKIQLAPAMSEQEYTAHIGKLAKGNQLFKTYIGLGYHQAVTPPVIQRNVLENPGWYTAYTPYQAEIAQG